ncbi:MAG: hypothetical protein K1060chlam2_00198 [Chlamydiae bacterium]|nr:hypothetical protein [Chlamydiota bacterium]
MEQRIYLHPDGGRYSVEELEQKLGYRHLSKNIFEEHEEIYRLGLEAEVSPEQEELGKRYIDQIESAYLPEISLHDLGEKVGYGLFAEESIPPGAYVGEYTGLVRKNDRRYSAPMNNYCYEYPVLDELERSYVIDATDGNFTRFINHSYDPNLKPVHLYHLGYFHLIFLAIREIKKGEQLCYNYGKHYWYVRRPPVSFQLKERD